MFTIERSWEAAQDGERFLVGVPFEKYVPPFTVVLNWQQELNSYPDNQAASRMDQQSRTTDSTPSLAEQRQDRPRKQVMINNRESSPMIRIAAFVFAVTLLAPGLLMLTGQEPARPSAFTAAQAMAGRISYENSCGQCHAFSLLGRTGQEGELPPISGLPATYQEFIGKSARVPPFAGKTFLSRWGDKTAAELIARFQVTAADPFFQFKGMNDDVVVNITAYVLQSNGAKPGPQSLTKTTAAVVNSLVQ